MGYSAQHLSVAATAAVLTAFFVSVGTAEPVSEGVRAPDFLLPSTNGGRVSLSDYQGQKMVLIEFYVADWDPDAAANLTQRRDDYQSFATLDTEVLGIALDHAYSQAAFAQSLELPFPLLSDYPNGRAVRNFGVGYADGAAERLLARAAIFLVDKEGIVRGYWGPANPAEAPAVEAVFSSEPMLARAREVLGRN